MNAYDLVTWPIRPLTKRVLRDLNDFAGITWFQLATASFGISFAAFMLRTESVTAKILVGCVYGWIVRDIARKRLDSAQALAQGPTGELESRLDGWFAGIIFWWATARIASGLSLLAVVDWAAFVFGFACSAWGPSSNDDNGTPYVVKAWRAAKTAVTRPRTASVGG